MFIITNLTNTFSVDCTGYMHLSGAVGREFLRRPSAGVGPCCPKGNRAGDGMACNNSDRRQWRKQEAVVGAAASEMQADAKQLLGAATRISCLRRKLPAHRPFASLQCIPQLVQQPQQLGIFLRCQQPGHIVVGLVEAEHRLFVEADALFGEHQLLEPGVRACPADGTCSSYRLRRRAG